MAADPRARRVPHAPHRDDLAADLALARSLADRAAEVVLGFTGSPVRWAHKGDGSPVTEADLAVERMLVEALAAERPGDDVLSEEGGGRERGTRRRWVIDPLDGTADFLAGGSDWGTHVALEVDGEVVVGVITRPVTGQSWWAARGSGAWGSPARRLAVSPTASLAAARVGGYVRPDSRWRATVTAAATWVDRASPILDLLEGDLDAVLSEGGYAWDHAPAVVLLAEAGGRFTDPAGGRRIDLRGGLYTNGHLHDALAAAAGGNGPAFPGHRGG